VLDQFRFLVSSVCVLVCMFVQPARSQSDEVGRTILTHYAGSVAFLYVRGITLKGQEEKKIGSGFVISNSGFVLTAAHLFRDGANSPYVSVKIVGSLGTSFDPTFPTGLVWPLELVKLGGDLDAALLKLPEIPNQTFTAIPLCARMDLPSASRILTLGFPLGQPLSINFGTLASKDGPRGLWKTDILVNEGSSGGPVFDTSAHAIGVIKGGITEAPGNNFFVPLSLIPELLAAGNATVSDCKDGIVRPAAKSNTTPLPQAKEFDNWLRVCAAGANIEVNADLLGSIAGIYEGDRTRGFASFRTTTEFLRQVPEAQRLDAYRLYTTCISKLLSGAQ
jgi:S1-C subfamily serine protease